MLFDQGVLQMGIYRLRILVASAVVGFLLESVPVAYVTARAWGVNILEVGTRNPGAANVFRSVNPLAGILVLVADTGKGFLAVVIPDILDETLAIGPAAGVAAVVGHCRSC